MKTMLIFNIILFIYLFIRFLTAYLKDDVIKLIYFWVFLIIETILLLYIASN